MSGLWSSVIGSFIEAWQELRIHKTRVMLSLIGVAVAVCAITTVVGLGAIAQQATVEASERSSGRPATLSLFVSPAEGQTLDSTRMDALWKAEVARYSIDYASRVVNQNLEVQFVDGAATVQVTGVDQPYGTMHRVELEAGTWFTKTDAERLAPAVIVNDAYYARLGRPDLSTHPTTTLLVDDKTVTAVVTGVYPAAGAYDTQPGLYMLADTLDGLGLPAQQSVQPPSYEVWVPVDGNADLSSALQRDIGATLGQGATVAVNRIDYAAFNIDPFASTKILINAVAGLVLALGALSLVNIALVTLSQRIREIGVRRSFGATSGRVFFAVMMESIVATGIAGVVGVIASVLIVSNSWVQEQLTQGQSIDVPPFPADAALLGLAAAVGVGALVGLLPAVVAVRVKVIDAIRY